MSNKTTLVIIACLLVGIIGSFLLKATMPSYQIVELILILGALFLSLITLAGVAVRAQWGYKFATLLFTLGIANVTLIYQWTGNYFLTYALTLGLIVSISRIGQKEEENDGYQTPATNETNGTQPTENNTEVSNSEPTKKTGKRGRPKKKSFNPRTDMKVFKE